MNLLAITDIGLSFEYFHGATERSWFKEKSGVDSAPKAKLLSRRASRLVARVELLRVRQPVYDSQHGVAAVDSTIVWVR
jgi:hypothetical protein